MNGVKSKRVRATLGAVLIALLCAACEGDPHKYTTIETIKVCDGRTEKVASFTLECIKGANPKSDEEPEDWIHKCKTMAEGIYCEVKPFTVIKFSNTGQKHGWDDVISKTPYEGT